ncbi:MAG TPA: hypothetical protein VMX17_12810, partial [Candidatus Glassbacteria bacterium]|nr:hypothetical protein [Candidatus Glassbacteria bacterium]
AVAKKKVIPKKKSTPEKKAVLKKKSTPEKKAVAKKKESTVKKDDFGFGVGSKASLFVKAISTKTGRTMKEIKELDWNDKNASFYDIFNRLVEKGLAKKDEKTNKMTLV